MADLNRYLAILWLSFLGIISAIEIDFNSQGTSVNTQQEKQ